MIIDAETRKPLDGPMKIPGWGITESDFAVAYAKHHGRVMEITDDAVPSESIMMAHSPEGQSMVIVDPRYDSNRSVNFINPDWSLAERQQDFMEQNGRIKEIHPEYCVGCGMIGRHSLFCRADQEISFTDSSD